MSPIEWSIVVLLSLGLGSYHYQQTQPDRQHSTTVKSQLDLLKECHKACGVEGMQRYNKTHGDCQCK